MVFASTGSDGNINLSLDHNIISSISSDGSVNLSVVSDEVIGLGVGDGFNLTIGVISGIGPSQPSPGNIVPVAVPRLESPVKKFTFFPNGNLPIILSPLFNIILNLFAIILLFLRVKKVDDHYIIKYGSSILVSLALLFIANYNFIKPYIIPIGSIILPSDGPTGFVLLIVGIILIVSLYNSKTPLFRTDDFLSLNQEKSFFRRLSLKISLFFRRQFEEFTGSITGFLGVGILLYHFFIFNNQLLLVVSIALLLFTLMRGVSLSGVFSRQLIREKLFLRSASDNLRISKPEGLLEDKVILKNYSSSIKGFLSHQKSSFARTPLIFISLSLIIAFFFVNNILLLIASGVLALFGLLSNFSLNSQFSEEKLFVKGLVPSGGSGVKGFISKELFFISRDWALLFSIILLTLFFVTKNTFFLLAPIILLVFKNIPFNINSQFSEEKGFINRTKNFFVVEYRSLMSDKSSLAAIILLLTFIILPKSYIILFNNFFDVVGLEVLFTPVVLVFSCVGVFWFFFIRQKKVVA